MPPEDNQPDPKPNWWIFGGDGGDAQERLQRLPDEPPWRRFDEEARTKRGKHFISRPEEIDMVNAALYLRRPLLVTGKPGVGKTSLTYAVAEDLGLGKVLRWSITTSTTLKEGLYHYDAIARLQDASLKQVEARAEAAQETDKTTPPPIGHYLRLGPLGTAFATSQKKRPRVLLIDEIDKSDIDLPNNLLHIFEEGEFTIPELERMPGEEACILPCDAPEKPVEKDYINVKRGKVRCEAFPLVVMTSNAEREFPPAFLRRCLKLDMGLPDDKALKDIVKAHLFGPGTPGYGRLQGEFEAKIDQLIKDFLERRNDTQNLAADQLLNAIYMVLRNADPDQRYGDRKKLIEALWRPLSD